jgi:hypothetical protein
MRAFSSSLSDCLKFALFMVEFPRVAASLPMGLVAVIFSTFQSPCSECE